MPVRGTKPKDEKRRRNQPPHEWVEIEERPFEGGPELPERGWHVDTLAWWADVSSMPHCVLWAKSDWRFAIDTARVAAAFHQGKIEAAVELRQREKLMGMTMDARRDLRIRYVEAKSEEPPKSITAVEDYRKRLAG